MLARGSARLRGVGAAARRGVSVVGASAPVEKNGEIVAEPWSSHLHTTKSERDMEMLGERLARGRQRGDVVFLRGDLGCGKTCLARGFVRAHTEKKELAVTSPTYLLVNTYDEAIDLPVVYHVDLYRLDAVTAQDTAALGLADAFEKGITLVEWPERFDNDSVPTDRLDVKISYDENDAEIRRVEFKPFGKRWAKLFPTSST